MFDIDKYRALARKAAAEGAVLLKNENQILPLKKGCHVAVFGRSQMNYYKSGTGSGGLVNTPYVVSVLEALKNSDDLIINEKILKTYTDWVEKNPFDEGRGWGMEPWSQEEMPLDDMMVRQAVTESDVAVIFIGRTAGEDQDNTNTEGSYLLNAGEEHMLDVVCRYFKNTVVLLNTGNIINMKWVRHYQPSAVMYLWQGGQEGGNGAVDLLTGKESPSGKLADTIAWDIRDYPSTEHFGGELENIYTEDIFTGYRYFETFAKENVIYPFGFGLSYTTFSIESHGFSWDGIYLTTEIEVTNTGKVPGKEVIQLYAAAPQGKMGKAERVLIAFQKTKKLEPGETERITLRCKNYDLASYDDSGASGYPSAYVLEQGTYHFFAGNQVRCRLEVGSFTLDETEVVQQLTQALAPLRSYERMKAVQTADGIKADYEQVPLRSYDLWERIQKDRPVVHPYIGNQGHQLSDVKSGKVTMEEFAAQIPEEQLCVLLRGEGMCSPKVTAGTAAAFGGISPALQGLGIPAACCADGPGGLRMDVGTLAFSLPNGTCLASSFNEQLSTNLFEYLGLEMRKNKIDILLGPGMNLHRSPLNGRNFEYFSEDPVLTGKIASAQLKGLHRHKVMGTLKHFAANNQEYRRHFTDSIVSERALRELYLKGFEIACKEADVHCMMTTYGKINGCYTASSYDLLTQILRKEWGYDGLVMTDWWARGNEEGQEGSVRENAAMVRSQNDIYMVTADAEKNSNEDNLMSSLGTGRLTVGELQRSAVNVLKIVLRTPAMERYLGCEEACYQELEGQEDLYETETEAVSVELSDSCELPLPEHSPKRGSRPKFVMNFHTDGFWRVELKLRSKYDSELAQLPVTLFLDGKLHTVFSLKGTETDWRNLDIPFETKAGESRKLELFFGQTGLEVGGLWIMKDM